MEIGIITNYSAGLLNFRKELLDSLIKEGHTVKIMYPKDDRDEEFLNIGCTTIDTPMNRRGMNPIKDIKYFLTLYKILRRERFDRVLTYTIKPNIYGGLSTRFLSVPTISNITGLGTMFEKQGFIRKVIISLYKSALKGKKHVVFQNQSNLEVFKNNKILSSAYTLVPGSGVNIERFPFHPIEPKKKVNFLFLGRVMEEKGIEELLTAFMSETLVDTTLKIVGFVESDYNGKLFKILKQAKGRITYEEFIKDPRELILESEVVINPSYHEGMSNVLLESGAMGRVLLASDIPGCKEIIDEGVNGFLFRPKSPESIVDKVQKYMQLDRETKINMGLQSHIKVTNEFDRSQIVDKYLKILEEKVW